MKHAPAVREQGFASAGEPDPVTESIEQVDIGLSDLGMVCRGSGADNVRNITASPAFATDPQELIDTLPLDRVTLLVG